MHLSGRLGLTCPSRWALLGRAAGPRGLAAESLCFPSRALVVSRLASYQLTRYYLLALARSRIWCGIIDGPKRDGDAPVVNCLGPAFGRAGSGHNQVDRTADTDRQRPRRRHPAWRLPWRWCVVFALPGQAARFQGHAMTTNNGLKQFSPAAAVLGNNLGRHSLRGNAGPLGDGWVGPSDQGPAQGARVGWTAMPGSNMARGSNGCTSTRLGPDAARTQVRLRGLWVVVRQFAGLVLDRK
jgi:hypothetical protein